MKRNVLNILIFLGLIALVVPFANAQGPSKKDQRKATKLISDGNKDIRNKDFQSAIEKYAEAVVLVPMNPEGHYWKGYAHYELKQYDMALSELNVAEKQGRPKADIAKIRWYLNYEKGNYDAALADVVLGLQAEPNSQMLLRASGDINFQKKNYREALASYQRAVLGTPNDGDLYYGIAQVQAALGDYKAQEAAASAAVTKPTKYMYEAYGLLADAYVKQRNYSSASDVYQRLISMKPNEINLYRLLSDTYRAQNKFPEAIETTKRALRLQPHNGDLFTDISWYYSLNNQPSDAVDAAKAAVELLPNQYMGYTNLCRAYNDTKQPDLAVSACNGALGINPDDGETYFYLGRALRDLGKTGEADRAFDKAQAGLERFTQNNPDYSDGFYLLGNAYYSNNQFDKALKAYQACLNLSPNFIRARYNSGVIQIKLRNKQGALDQYNQLLNYDKDLAERLKAEIDKM